MAELTSAHPKHADRKRGSSSSAKWLLSLLRNPSGLLGMILVVAVLLVAALAPYLAPHEPTTMNLRARNVPPVWIEGGSSSHPLGTDQLGRDLLSRVLYGARISVVVGVLGVLISMLIGVTLGLLSGYFGGRIDSVISRVLDTFMSIPFIILALALVGVLGPNLLNLIIALGLTGWVTFTRVVRGEVLSVKTLAYVEAAAALGQSTFFIIARHILPNVAASIIVLGTLQVATIIIAESALSFLGLGVQPPTVTWGGLLADGRQYLATSWWLSTFPGIAITLTALGIILLGDWLRDVLDPRQTT
jgi:peptide/nickel transport system permease protein